MRTFSVSFIIVVTSIAWAGCSGTDAPTKLDPDQFVQQKIDAMTKMAEVAEQGNPENRIIDALEAYRAIPFEPKKQTEAAKTILAIYQTRIAGKVKGDGAADIAGEMAILQREMTSP